ncbi:MAG: FAD-dependent oxidoreductase, partial [Pseudomonadota bacterium]|nr:FAD-dependent oxidoreductase [Pseudomonadota bacterium]
MASTIEIKVPDIGNYHDVPVIELLVKPGDTVRKDQGLVTLESDKATMEVPAPAAGVVKELKVKLGDAVSEGTLVALIEAAASVAAVAAPPEPAKAAGSTPATRPAAVAAPATIAPAPGAVDGRTPDMECALLVLGAGPGGYTAAFRAADLGLDVVLVERYASLGGVCLNVGCIPSKALLHTAEVIAEAEAMAAHGVSFGTPRLDLDKLRAFKNGVVGKLTGGLAGMAKQRKVRVLQGIGQFVAPHELDVQTDAGVKRVRFAQAIIAAGSQALKLPGFPWDDARVMDS